MLHTCFATGPPRCTPSFLRGYHPVPAYCPSARVLRRPPHKSSQVPEPAAATTTSLRFLPAVRPCIVRRPPSSRPTKLAACTFRCSTTSPARPSSADTTEPTLHDATTHRARALQVSSDPSFKVNYFSKHFLYSSPPPSDDVDRVERI